MHFSYFFLFLLPKISAKLGNGVTPTKTPNAGDDRDVG